MQAKRDAALARRALSQLTEGRWLSCRLTEGNLCDSELKQQVFLETLKGDLVPGPHAPLPATSTDRVSRHVCLQPSTSGRDHQGSSSWKHGPIAHGHRLFTVALPANLTSGANHMHTTICRGFAANAGAPRSIPSSGPSLQDFIQTSYRPSGDYVDTESKPNVSQIPYLRGQPKLSGGRVYFETYGCQMNVSDMETVLAIMNGAGYNKRADKAEDADVIFVMTCAIRENAERKVRSLCVLAACCKTCDMFIHYLVPPWLGAWKECSVFLTPSFCSSHV